MSKPNIKRSKRTHYRFRGVIFPTASHPAIRRLKRKESAPSIHGDKLWKSSCLLIDYLHRHPPEHTKRVLDAGCGWGMTGIWCASKLNSKVTAVDADPAVFPYLDAAAALNDVRIKTLQSRFEKLRKARLARYDMLVAADICFWDELVDPVYNLVNRAVKAGVRTIIVADPERPTFVEMAERCVDKHGGELLDWKVSGSVKATGALLVIENA